MKDIYLSVIIPSYNEIANLRLGVLDKIAQYLKKQAYSYEVVIVDDGSTDGTTAFVEHFIEDNEQFRLIKNPHFGKAGAVTTGMLNALGSYRLFTDMDQATPIEEVAKMLPFIQGEYDIVIGSRTEEKLGYPWTRVILHSGMILVRKMIVGLPDIHDTQCGFKLFKENVAITLFQKIYDLHHGFKKIRGSAVTAGFDVELLYIAEKMGYKIKEVPVDWLYVDTKRVSPIRDSIDAITSLLTIRLNSTKGIYEKR